MLSDIDAKELIPQREPIQMTDTLYEASENDARTGFVIRKENLFLENGHLSEMGIIENMAQSAAATAGVRTYINGEKPLLGYIGEIKKCIFHRLPEVGETLTAEVHYVSEAAGVVLYNIESHTENGPCAECRMKVFLES